jgi:poly-gamma-glutamate synthesis protein (capsule biosynthesis protein)
MKKSLMLVFGAGIILILLTGLFFKYKDNFISRQNDSTPSILPTPTPLTVIKPDELESNLMYFGDVFWGRYVNDWAQRSDLKEAYTFSGLYTLGREKYDAWIGSLNCPITDNNVSSEYQNTYLKFNCTPNYLEEAQKWFNIFSLANSHTDNMNGLEGFNSTREYLDQYDIQYFGHFDKNVTDEICDIVNVTAAPLKNAEDYRLLEDTNYKYEEFTIPIAMCGYHNTFSLPTDEQLAEISNYSDNFITLVYAIQGPEYALTADGLQQKYFRLMIDNGADAVLGKGAHVVQNTESYNGKLIVYSMGNFIYDQQVGPDKTQGIGVEVKLNVSYDENIEKWQELVEECKDFADDCLDTSDELSLSKPEFTVEYGIVGTDNSNKLTRKGDENVQARMLARTNWQSTLSGLKK